MNARRKLKSGSVLLLLLTIGCGTSGSQRSQQLPTLPDVSELAVIKDGVIPMRQTQGVFTDEIRIGETEQEHMARRSKAIKESSLRRVY